MYAVVVTLHRDQPRAEPAPGCPAACEGPPEPDLASSARWWRHTVLRAAQAQDGFRYAFVRCDSAQVSLVLWVAAQGLEHAEQAARRLVERVVGAEGLGGHTVTACRAELLGMAAEAMLRTDL